MDTKVIYPPTRDDARRTKEKHYFTGKPCPHGHVAPRYTSNGGCSECLSLIKLGADAVRGAPLPKIANQPRLCRKKKHIFTGRTCPDCHKEYQRLSSTKKYHAIAQGERSDKCRKFSRELRGSTPCKDCGKIYPWYVMEFDHRNGRTTGEKTIAKCVGIGNMNLLCEEIKKCDIVCANCHRVRTHERDIAAGRRKRID